MVDFASVFRLAVGKCNNFDGFTINDKKEKFNKIKNQQGDIITDKDIKSKQKNKCKL